MLVLVPGRALLCAAPRELARLLDEAFRVGLVCFLHELAGRLLGMLVAVVSLHVRGDPAESPVLRHAGDVNRIADDTRLGRDCSTVSLCAQGLMAPV